MKMMMLTKIENRYDHCPSTGGTGAESPQATLFKRSSLVTSKYYSMFGAEWYVQELIASSVFDSWGNEPI